ncbi:MAG: ABC transporter substrate-binding protein [Gammaproteobacteria bacterium]|nr:ABC transporter substrate-binding protein [Gammaproteobacteria bacterium]
MHGAPRYPADFSHFDYVNPNAPKGGVLRRHDIGTFDSLNPFILKGVAEGALGLTYDTLTEHAADEAFSEYGLIAKTIEVAPDRSWVAYRLRPEARFHDGQPITADDVVFTLDVLKRKGRPFYRAYYANVVRAEKLADDHVKFHFENGDNAELPLIVGQMPVLPAHYWQDREFDKTTLEAPLGSGPYRVKSVDPGRSIVYERVKDYWAENLPVRRGQNNFDEIRIDYYRDETVALEAFKAGEYDLRQENNSKVWATLYEGPPFEKQLIKTTLIEHELPTGMQGFIFNTRRPMFADRKVREALAYAFDFEWTNKNLFYGQYTRTSSYFSNSELASSGLPDAAERALLEPYRGRVPDEVFDQTYQPPATDGSGNNRKQLRTALGMLKDSGWTIENKRLVKDGQPFEFEMLLVQPAFERVVLPFAENLDKIGIKMNVRTVDAAQYQKRLEEFDFDMVVGGFGQSLSPGNEQRDFWGSDKADVPGSRNIIGIRDPVVDALIDRVIAAPDRNALITTTRALDRVLLWGHYVIPNWHIRAFRVAYWDKFGQPDIRPRYALGLMTWWQDADKAARIEAAR